MSANPQGSNPVSTTIRPPQLINSLVGGFNTAANHVVLLALPALLDLLLWFGPRVGVKQLFGPLMAEMIGFTRQNAQSEMLPILDNFERLWEQFLERFNLLSVLNTFPVGVPSQMAGMMPDANPLGKLRVVEIGSGGQLVLGWLALTLVGFVLGSLYFALVARASLKPTAAAVQLKPDSGRDEVNCGERQPGGPPALRLGSIGWQAAQALVMTVIILILVLAIMAPAAIFSTLVALISPLAAQFVLLMVSFSLIWFMIPLIFSPHGIFMCGQSALNAMLNSARLVRVSLPGTGLFLIALLVLNQGLGSLWNSAPYDSWLGLVSIFGRAFISTALLAASFSYYRAGLKYVQSLRRRTA